MTQQTANVTRMMMNVPINILAMMLWGVATEWGGEGGINRGGGDGAASPVATITRIKMIFMPKSDCVKRSSPILGTGPLATDVSSAQLLEFASTIFMRSALLYQRHKYMLLWLRADTLLYTARWLARWCSERKARIPLARQEFSYVFLRCCERIAARPPAMLPSPPSRTRNCSPIIVSLTS